MLRSIIRRLSRYQSRVAACLGAGLFAVSLPVSAMAEPVVKVINFTADWCPNCQVLNPRLDEALSRMEEGLFERVDLDLTDVKTDDEAVRQAVFRDAIATADAHKTSYLWDWYGGVTGIAVLVSADNGEPISCVNRALNADEIERRLKEAELLSLRAPAGQRKPNGPDCPPPIG